MDGSSELRTTSWTLTQGYRRLRTFCSFCNVVCCFRTFAWPSSSFCGFCLVCGCVAFLFCCVCCCFLSVFGFVAFPFFSFCLLHFDSWMDALLFILFNAGGVCSPTLDYPSGLPGPGCYWCLPPYIDALCAAWLPCICLVCCLCFASALRVYCSTDDMEKTNTLKTKSKTIKTRKARQQNKCWVIPVLVSSFCPCCSASLFFFVASVFCKSLRMCFGAFLSVSVVGCVLWLWLLLSLWCLPWPLLLI